MSPPRSWRDKLADDKDFPRVEKISPAMAKKFGQGTIVIPRPREVDELMRRVPPGKWISINQIRAAVAKRHGATIGCPIVVGIFARTAAGAAEEDRRDGITEITPYWRTLRSGGEINPKYPGGIEEQAERLRAEGHQVVARGKRVFIADAETTRFAL